MVEEPSVMPSCMRRDSKGIRDLRQRGAEAPPAPLKCDYEEVERVDGRLESPPP
jgi:hypothetical protein